MRSNLREQPTRGEGTGNARILLVDDDPEMAWLFRRLLEPHHHTVTCVMSGDDALKSIEREEYHLIFLDLFLNKVDGLEILKRIKQTNQIVPVIIITGYADVGRAVEAIKAGAHDFLEKPFDIERLRRILIQAMENHARGGDLRCLSGHQFDTKSLGDEMGQSRSITKISEWAEAIANTDYTVLIRGETGVGKEVVSRHIHRRSTRRNGPFIGLDCGAIPESLFESQLFGHERGAFTGADKEAAGIFLAANGGTLLLDEITNLPLNLQQKFLRVLEEKEYLPVGGRRVIQFDVRIIATCSERIEEKIQKGEFRDDLFHRISELSIEVPPLRERKEDIPFLISKFQREINRELGKNTKRFPEKAIRMSMEYDYPGNVRELKNIVRRAMLSPDGIIAGKGLDGISVGRKGRENWPVRTWVEEGLSLKDISDRVAREAEREAIRLALQRANYNRTKAATALRIDRKTLYRKLMIKGGEE